MNTPAVLGVIHNTLEDLPLADVTISYGGEVGDFPDKIVAVLGTEEGDEEWATTKGPADHKRRYSLGLEVMVGGHGLDQPQATEEAFEIFEQVRDALNGLDVRSRVPSVVAPLQVVFQSYNPGVLPEGRAARITAFIRVEERG